MSPQDTALDESIYPADDILGTSENSGDENYVPKSHGVNFLGSKLEIGGVEFETTFDKFSADFCWEYDDFRWSKIGSILTSRTRQTGIFTLCFDNIGYVILRRMRI